MDKNDKLEKDSLGCFPEIEYFLNASLSSLLNGYVPPKELSSDNKTDDTEVLDDEFFEDVDKKVKF